VGEVMVIDDHIDFVRRGANRLSECDQPRHGKIDHYCPRLIAGALASARRAGFKLHRGIYAAMTGPNYETRAEYRFLRAIGADAVGMSTVPEVVVAAECEVRVLALSAITNICPPDRTTPARHGDVIAAAQSAEPKLRQIILDAIAEHDGGRVVVHDSTAASNGNGSSRLSLASKEMSTETVAK
jgi:purine-nucleoside phosphorylase